MKKFIAFLLTFFVIFTVIGCQNDKLPTKINLSGVKAEVKVNEKFVVSFSIDPKEATNKNVTAVVEPSDRATVNVNNSSGKIDVTGKKVGDVKVTLTCEGDKKVKTEFSFKVVENSPTKVTIRDKDTKNKYNVGATVVFGATVEPANATNRGVKWSSSNESIATITSVGTLKAVSVGVVTIRATSTFSDDIYDEHHIEIVTEGGAVVVELESLSLTLNEVLYLGNKYTIKVTKTPANAEYIPVWSSSNEEVISIDPSNGAIELLKTGTATITLTADGTGDDDNPPISTSVDVTVENAPALESFTISNAREIEIDETCNLQIVTNPAYALYNIDWSIADTSIATITEDGKVTGVAVGTTTITAKDKTTGIQATVDISIKEPFNANTPPQKISITVSETNLFVGYRMQIIVEAFPSGTSNSVTWELSDPSIGIVDENDVLIALSKGTLRVTARSTLDSNVVAKETFYIKDAPPELPIPDLKGYEIKIMQTKSSMYELDPFLDNYAGIDRAIKQIVWRDIESKFNCKMLVVPYPDDQPWGKGRADWLSSTATDGISQTDFAVVAPAWLKSLSEGNGAMDVTKFYEEYGQNQLEPSLKEAASFGGKLYAITTGVSLSKNYPYHGLFYNYGLLKARGLESPAKLFNEGKWSYDEFYNYCLAAQSVLREDEFVIAGSPVLIWSGMVNSSGIKLADKSTMDLNLKHKYSIDAVNVLRDIVEAGAWDIDNIELDNKVVSFNEGKAIFQPGEYWFLRRDDRWKADIWGDETEFGYVPFPYHSDVSKSNAKVNVMGDSVIIQVGGRSYPAGVEAGFVYRAVVKMYLDTSKELQKSEGYDPEQIKYDAALKRVDDQHSVTATTFFKSKNTLFDPLFDQSFQLTYTGDTATAIINAVKNGNNPSEELEAIFNSVKSAFTLAHGVSAG